MPLEAIPTDLSPGKYGPVPTARANKEEGKPEHFASEADQKWICDRRPEPNSEPAQDRNTEGQTITAAGGNQEVESPESMRGSQHRNTYTSTQVSDVFKYKKSSKSLMAG